MYSVHDPGFSNDLFVYTFFAFSFILKMLNIRLLRIFVYLANAVFGFEYEKNYLTFFGGPLKNILDTYICTVVYEQNTSILCSLISK